MCDTIFTLFMDLDFVLINYVIPRLHGGALPVRQQEALFVQKASMSASAKASGNHSRMVLSMKGQ